VRGAENQPRRFVPARCLRRVAHPLQELARVLLLVVLLEARGLRASTTSRERSGLLGRHVRLIFAGEPFQSAQ